MSTQFEPGERFEIIDRISPTAIVKAVAAHERGETDDASCEIMFTTYPLGSYRDSDDDPPITMIRFVLEREDEKTGLNTHRLYGHLFGDIGIPLRVQYTPTTNREASGYYGFIEVREV